jgi:hemolysin-activating ACP:hemolysin acyltransferase
MLVTSSKNQNRYIVSLIEKKFKSLSTEQISLLYELIEIFKFVPNFYKSFTYDEFVETFVFPMLIDQCVTLYENNKLVGFITYAFLNKQAEEKFLKKNGSFTLEDHNSGKNLWVLVVYSPFGHGRLVFNKFRKRMRDQGHKKKLAKFMRVYKNGKDRINQVMI